ncbi:MAG: hypothetical protein MK207_02675 [Saprospiraceae bacterium]|nr:hypothetical protein [Saprospiraceae bacterium]
MEFFPKIILVLICLLFACEGNDKSKICKYKPPVAIFSGIDSFEDHSFDLKGQSSVEYISIPKMNMDIQLYQSGCDDIQQEFRFLLHEAYPLNTPPDVCAMHIAGIFYMLSQEAPQQLGLLQQWAETLKANSKSFNYNEKIVFFDSDISAQIDKIHQPESAVLSIVFYN